MNLIRPCLKEPTFAWSCHDSFPSCEWLVELSVGPVFKPVHDWLYDEKQKWVLILDNLGDDCFLHKAPANQEGPAGGQNSMLKAVTLGISSYKPEWHNSNDD
jgi:hypothetical protein